ncbi:VWA domain-containing protein [Hymenobacter cellulosilyticus]|uniref:VWA domain-containing protein n=1 Tax=Hymenobacter cellulosilyticus TaxID=2932248 RepID=A0A8T9Q9U5_9BACT|nr:VWA domain-containing protein [Hymenobacter cellulosilyticus]UOQ71703.1 VWA domain-containing protein [Hymenobacter cellulosilyticus]
MLLILLIPVLFLVRWLLVHRRRPRLGVAFVAGQLRRDYSASLRFLPDIVLGLSLAFGIVALARPQRTDERVVQTGQGIDILLLVDVSSSMELQDLRPNRLEAAKRVAREFVDGRSGDRIGLVVFAGDAYSMAPLTTDYELLRENLQSLQLGMIANDGTAIGTALGVATNRLRDSRSRTKVCILISDGENTAGNLDPLTAAQLAHAFGVKIYTIGLGKDGYVPYGQDETGRPATWKPASTKQPCGNWPRPLKASFSAPPTITPCATCSAASTSTKSRKSSRPATATPKTITGFICSGA